jgi:hypothetical protein
VGTDWAAGDKLQVTYSVILEHSLTGVCVCLFVLLRLAADRPIRLSRGSAIVEPLNYCMLYALYCDKRASERPTREQLLHWLESDLIVLLLWIKISALY